MRKTAAALSPQSPGVTYTVMSAHAEPTTWTSRIDAEAAADRWPWPSEIVKRQSGRFLDKWTRPGWLGATWESPDPQMNVR